MDAGNDLFNRVVADLRRGSVALARLGPSTEPASLSLNDAGAMERYAQRMAPQITTAIDKNQSLQTVLVVLLICLFVVAATLSVLGQFKGWTWAEQAGLIPGLGVTTAWPIRKLTQLRDENIRLRLLPALLPAMAPELVLKVLGKVFGI